MSTFRFLASSFILLLPFLCNGFPARHHAVSFSSSERSIELSSSVRMDPSCQNGIKSKNVCCPRVCGQCGGKGCGKLSTEKKTLCCRSQVRKSARKCTNVVAPCKIVKSNSGSGFSGGSTSMPCKPSSSAGAWNIAPVNSGSLVQRHEACAVMVNGLVVLLGGRGKNKAVSVYNPKTKTWQNRGGPGFGVEIHHTQCVVQGCKVFVVSSWKGGFPKEQNNERVWIYDVCNDEWTDKAGLPAWRSRGGGAAVLRNGLIYVVGGARGGHGEHATTTGWMDSYDIANDKWNLNLPPMPDGRDHVGGAMVNGELCVAGGRDGGSASFFTATKASVYCFNFNTNAWVKKKDLLVPRAGSSYGKGCDGRLVMAGGEGNGQAYSRVDYFDGTNWGSPTFLKDSRHGSGVAVSQCCCGHMFIPSGSGNLGGSPELFTTEHFIPTGKPATCENY